MRSKTCRWRVAALLALIPALTLSREDKSLLRGGVKRP